MGCQQTRLWHRHRPHLMASPMVPAPHIEYRWVAGPWATKGVREACDDRAMSHSRPGQDAEILLTGNWQHWVGSGVEMVLVVVVALQG